MVTFKVGDRVRVVSGWSFVGVEGFVERPTNGYSVGVRIPSEPFTGTSDGLWNCHPTEIRLLPNRPTVSRILSLTPATKKVVGHLEKVGTISPMEAQVVLGLPKVAKQVWEARQHGWNVKTEYKKDASGKRYARYSLAA